VCAVLCCAHLSAARSASAALLLLVRRTILATKAWCVCVCVACNAV
jgi:hypothetical protein